MTDKNPTAEKEAREMLAHCAARRKNLDEAGEFIAELTVEAIDASRRAGLTLSAIGEVLNMTHQRVAQLTTERRTDDREKRDT